MGDPDKVTLFPNFQKNPDTIKHQQEYEENEAPPPKLDSRAADAILSNGQFLFKNQVMFQDIIKEREERAR